MPERSDNLSEVDFLTENEVIAGVVNYFYHKGRTENRRIVRQSDATIKQKGVDLHFRLENESKNGNSYFIEAKGNRKSDGSEMTSSCKTNFRWAISQIILRINTDSRKYNYIYGIAMPNSDIEKCICLIKNNWALKHLKIRLYGAYRNEAGELTAKEYLPRDIYS